MAKKPKIDPAVEAAEARVAELRKKLAEAEGVVVGLRATLGTAIGELDKARVAADASLPQCDVSRFTVGRRSYEGRYVLLRKTPTGQIVARPVGGAAEQRFKPHHFGTWRAAPRYGIRHLVIEKLPEGFA